MTQAEFARLANLAVYLELSADEDAEQERKRYAERGIRYYATSTEITHRLGVAQGVYKAIEFLTETSVAQSISKAAHKQCAEVGRSALLDAVLGKCAFPSCDYAALPQTVKDAASCYLEE